jgi:signal transduction histidine kinase
VSTILALAEHTQTYFSRTAPAPFWVGLLLMQPPWLLLGLLALPVVRVAIRFPVDRAHWRVSVPLHAVSAVAFAYLHLGLLATFHRLVLRSPVPIVAQTVDLAVFYVVQDMFIYFTIVAGTHAWSFYRAIEIRERDAMDLRARLTDARLEALQRQIQPHFFFNTLNTVVMLARNGETGAVVKVLTSLSDLLRYSLYGTQSYEVELRSEIAFIRQYLAIEQARFGSRLAVTWSLAEETEDCLVPSLILQPLVENAVVHGLSKIASQARLTVGARRAGGSLVLEVEDNGPGLGVRSAGELRGGIGLRNVAERLEVMYGSAATLHVGSGPGQGTYARVSLPYHDRIPRAPGPDAGAGRDVAMVDAP